MASRVPCPMAVLALVLGAQAAAAEPRVTLETLSDDNRRILFEQIDRAAVFEGAARVCGVRTNAEARARAAVRDCVTSESLDRVSARFARRVKAESDVPSKQFCAHPQAKSLLGKYTSFLDRTLAEAASLCRRCLSLGICG